MGNQSLIIEVILASRFGCDHFPFFLVQLIFQLSNLLCLMLLVTYYNWPGLFSFTPPNLVQHNVSLNE